MTISFQKSTFLWRQYRPEMMELVFVYGPKWQKMVTTISIACVSAVCQVGPVKSL
jgi:hypothetical protein